MPRIIFEIVKSGEIYYIRKRNGRLEYRYEEKDDYWWYDPDQTNKFWTRFPDFATALNVYKKITTHDVVVYPEQKKRWWHV